MSELHPKRGRRSVLHDWWRQEREHKEELAYLKAERAGIRRDNHPIDHTLKVEEFSYIFAPHRPIYSMIRLKGRWLARIFPPNTRVVLEKGEHSLILRKDR